jgi:hypothetical protein
MHPASALRRVGPFIVACLGALAMLVAPAQAGDTTCAGPLTGTFDNIIVPSGGNCNLTNSTVTGNVKVLSGGGLQIGRSTVWGNVEAEEGHLYFGISNQSEIRGNVIAKGTTGSVAAFGNHNYLCATDVRGDVQIERSSASSPWSIGALIQCARGNQIDGNLNAFKNRARLRIERNILPLGPPQILGVGLIRGNIHFEDNTSTTGPHTISQNNVHENVQVFKNIGGVTISANIIGEDLQCKDNTPPATATGNTVGGNSQCLP